MALAVLLWSSGDDPRKEALAMTTPTLPQIDFATVGPPVGARFPDVRLPDQHDRVVDLHGARDGRRALIVFYRSARW